SKKGAGWAVAGHEKPANHTAVFIFAEPLAGGPGTTLTVRLRHQSPFPQHNIGHFRLGLTSAEKPSLSDKAGLPADVAQALPLDAARRTPAQQDAVAKFYRGV